MKILHILNELKYSGAEIMYVDAASEFQRLGCKLYVVNTAQELGEFAPSFRTAGYEVLHMPYPSNILNRFRYYIKMYSFIKSEGIDVVHIHRSNMKWGMAMVAFISGCRSVYTIHNCFRNPALTLPYQRWLRWSATHLFGCRMQSISDSVYRNELDTYHNQTHLVYNWFGNQRFTPPIKTKRDRCENVLEFRMEPL